MNLGDLHPDWHHQAACHGQSELFFSGDPADQRSAKSICRTCPVRRECTEQALLRNEQYGIWGGFDADTLDRMLRRVAGQDPESVVQSGARPSSRTRRSERAS